MAKKFTAKERRAIFNRADSLASWLDKQGIRVEYDVEIVFSDDAGDFYTSGSIPRDIDPLVAGVMKVFAKYYVSHYYPANEQEP